MLLFESVGVFEMWLVGLTILNGSSTYQTISAAETSRRYPLRVLFRIVPLTSGLAGD